MITAIKQRNQRWLITDSEGKVITETKQMPYKKMVEFVELGWHVKCVTPNGHDEIIFEAW